MAAICGIFFAVKSTQSTYRQIFINLRVSAERRNGGLSRDCHNASCRTSADGGSCWYREKAIGKFWRSTPGPKINDQKQGASLPSEQAARADYRSESSHQSATQSGG